MFHGVTALNCLACDQVFAKDITLLEEPKDWDYLLTKLKKKKTFVSFAQIKWC